MIRMTHFGNLTSPSRSIFTTLYINNILVNKTDSQNSTICNLIFFLSLIFRRRPDPCYSWPSVHAMSGSWHRMHLPFSTAHSSPSTKGQLKSAPWFGRPAMPLSLLTSVSVGHLFECLLSSPLFPCLAIIMSTLHPPELHRSFPLTHARLRSCGIHQCQNFHKVSSWTFLFTAHSSK